MCVSRSNDFPVSQQGLAASIPSPSGLRLEKRRIDQARPCCRLAVTKCCRSRDVRFLPDFTDLLQLACLGQLKAKFRGAIRN